MIIANDGRPLRHIAIDPPGCLHRRMVIGIHLLEGNSIESSRRQYDRHQAHRQPGQAPSQRRIGYPEPPTQALPSAPDGSKPSARFRDADHLCAVVITIGDEGRGPEEPGPAAHQGRTYLQPLVTVDRRAGDGAEGPGVFQDPTDKMVTKLGTAQTAAVRLVIKQALSTLGIGQVEVDMGEPILEGRKIPADSDGKVLDHPLKVDGKVYRVGCVSMGNPHCVLYVEDLQNLDLQKMGPSFEHHSFFPNRVNTEFVKILGPGEVRMRVWERGAGETLSSGTGSSAICVAAKIRDLIDDDVEISVAGGTLKLSWSGDGDIFLEGPVTEVFSGMWSD